MGPEITPVMIEAGAVALATHDPEHFSMDEIIESIWRAMASAVSDQRKCSSLMSDDSEDDAHVLTEVECLERDKSIMAGEIRRLAHDLLAIAGQVAPNNYFFATDPRCRYARAMLTKYKKARR